MFKLDIHDTVASAGTFEAAYYNPWGSILSSIAWAVRSSHHSTLGHIPAQLVFGRDMIFNLRTVANWKEISHRKQRQVDLDHLRSNKSRVDFDYQPGQQVYITRDGIFRKLEGPKLGPFPICDPPHLTWNITVRGANDTEAWFRVPISILFIQPESLPS